MFDILAIMLQEHSGVVTINEPNTVIENIDFVATNEAASAIQITADNVTIRNVTITNAAIKRWSTPDQHAIAVLNADNVTIENVTINGSAAAGIFIYGSNNFNVSHVTVNDTQADAIHITAGSSNGIVHSPVINGSGDDGIGIVSYLDQPQRCENIQVQSPRVTNQKWGRAFAVVGGKDILFTNVYAEHSSSASIYVAAEPSYNTWGNENVQFVGGTIKEANQESSVNHGAVLIYNNNPGQVNDNVTVRDITIYNTRSTASWNVAVLSWQPQTRILLRNIKVTNGPKTAFNFVNTSRTDINRINCYQNGKRLPDLRGW